MKKLIIIASLILTSLNLSAQTNTIALVENSSAKILYQGVENKLNIFVEKHDVSEIRLEISSGEIEQRNNSFFVIPGKTSEAEIRIIAAGYLIKKETYKIVKIPEPLVYVGSKKEGLLEKTELLKAKKIALKFENPNFDTLFILKEFSISAEINGKREKAKSNGYNLSETQIQLIRRMPAGEIIFEDIILETRDKYKKQHIFQTQSKYRIDGVQVFFEIELTGENKNFKLSEITNNTAKFTIKNLQGKPLKKDYSIQSFEIHYTQNNILTKYRAFSQDFTPEMIEAVKTSKTNYFEIKKIAVKNNINGESQYVDDISFYITERD